MCEQQGGPSSDDEPSAEVFLRVRWKTNEKIVCFFFLRRGGGWGVRVERVKENLVVFVVDAMLKCV